jgi:hypothetical protein
MEFGNEGKTELILRRAQDDGNEKAPIFIGAFSDLR